MFFENFFQNFFQKYDCLQYTHGSAGPRIAKGQVLKAALMGRTWWRVPQIQLVILSKAKDLWNLPAASQRPQIA
jgi:hypothetical protein